VRIKDKLMERKIRGIMSDESDYDEDESEEEAKGSGVAPKFAVDEAEYNFQKA